MAVAPGTLLGPYEIRGSLGAGGMGEVYRALDPRIGREVAIKILPSAFAKDENRLARFDQEARAAGVLNHPGILAVHDIGQDGDVHYLVTELLEGETLRAKLGSPLPQRKIVDYALQIAKGLAAAHDKGIIHRDLKPENLFVTKDGRVKILDFGLAKLTQPDAAADVSKLQTGAPESAEGVILGTVGYMSPEQIRGKPADHRSDIFAFGVILYEMTTGRRAFHGETAADTMSAILGKEPPEISGSNPNLSPAISRIVEHCMEKSPEQRFQSVHDVAFYLETLSGVSATSIPIAPVEARKSPLLRPWIPWTFGMLAIAGSIVFFLMQRSAKPGLERGGMLEPYRFAIQLAANQELNIQITGPIFSPDGRSIVFCGAVDGHQYILRRGLRERQAAPIPGTEDGSRPFFSPDGRWLCFFANNQLLKVPLEGGRPIPLEKGNLGGTWLVDDTIVFSPAYMDGLFRISADGGTPERLTTPDHNGGVLGHYYPQGIPGSRWVLFTAFRTPVDTSKVGVVNLETKEIRWLVDGGFFGKYVQTGHLLYAKGNRLYAVPFDAANVAVKGSAKPVLDDLLVVQTGAYGMFDVSSTGMLAYITESLGQPPKELVWLDREGHATEAAREQNQYASVSLSNDDKQAALTVYGESQDLWIYSFARGTLSRITTSNNTEFGPIWSPDDSELYYVVDRPPYDIYRISARVPDSGQPMWKTPAKYDTVIHSVSPDGRKIVYTLVELETGRNIYSRPLDGSEPPRPFRATRSEENFPSFSPDGNWLVYQSDETGRAEIYVEAFPGPGERFQISADGGRMPRWARNGEIFFLHDNEVRGVTTRPGRRFEFDAPRTLFVFPTLCYTASSRFVPSYDVTADGKRILAIAMPEALRPRQIDIVTDWTSELARLVPADKH